MRDIHDSTRSYSARLDLVGVTGLLYWYGIDPLHQLVFAGVLRNVARAARSHRRLSS